MNKKVKIRESEVEYFASLDNEELNILCTWFQRSKMFDDKTITDEDKLLYAKILKAYNTTKDNQPGYA